MRHDFRRVSFSRRTTWASHFLGPPWFLLPCVRSSVERDGNGPTSLSRGEGPQLAGCPRLVAGRGGEDEGSGVGGGKNQRLMADSNSAPRSMIVCDLDAGYYD